MTHSNDEIIQEFRQNAELLTRYKERCAQRAAELQHEVQQAGLQSEVADATLEWINRVMQLGNQGADLVSFRQQMRDQMRLLPVLTEMVEQPTALPTSASEADYDNPQSYRYWAIVALRAIYYKQHFRRYGTLAAAFDKVHQETGENWRELSMSTPDGQTTLGADVSTANGWVYRAILDFYQRTLQFSRGESHNLSDKEDKLNRELELHGVRSSSYALVVLVEWNEDNKEKEDSDYRRPRDGRGKKKRNTDQNAT